MIGVWHLGMYWGQRQLFVTRLLRIEKILVNVNLGSSGLLPGVLYVA